MKFSENPTRMIMAIALLLIGLGCNTAGLTVTTPRALPTPIAVQPTATPPPATEEASNPLEAQVIAVYENVSPAVVNITNRGYVYDFFMQAVPQEGSGSGFVYDKEGHIVTNYHVIENADELSVTLANGKVYDAKVIGADPTNDLAVIGLNANVDLPEPMVLGDSGKLRVGQFVVAIGNPFGLERTLTTGVISALGRVIQSPEDNRFIGEAIQTDASINPGNSGGPLLDLKGRVIGVNSQIISPSQASAGIGFAVSANTVRRVVPELIARGYYPHPWLGATMLTVTTASAKVFRDGGMQVPVEAGLLVSEVTPGGPADAAGIRGGDRAVRAGRYQLLLGGDIITAINGKPVGDFQEMTVYLETQTKVGDSVQVTVIRDGQEQTLAVTLGEQPRSQ
jgi:S1-C subfamily serine protease